MDGLGRREQVGRRQDEAAVLPAAQPAVAADQRLEGGHVEGVGVDGAVDVDVRRLRPSASPPAAWPGRASPNAASGSTPSTTPGREVVPAGRPDRHRTVVAEDRDEADARMPGQPRDEGGPARVQLRQREPLRLGDVDQPEVAAAEHDQLGVRLGLLGCDLLLRPGARPPASTPEALPPDRSSSTESTRPHPSTLPSIPVVSEWVSYRHSSLRSSAVARRERLALGLAVVAEEHEVVAPGRSVGHPLQDGEHLVEAGQRGQGLDPGAPGVVRDLVVVDVVHVDAAGTAHHRLAHHRRC